MDFFLKFLTISLSLYVSCSSPELTEFLWSDDEVSGVYKNEDGSLGITFVCRAGQLQVETLNHVTIVNLGSFHTVDKRMACSIHILSGEYLQHKHVGHKHLDRSVGDTTKPLNETVRDLLQMEEIALLEDASRAVGERGVTGKNTPMVLPFHMFALRMTRLLDISSQNAITNEQTEQSSVPVAVSSQKKRAPDCKKHKPQGPQGYAPKDCVEAKKDCKKYEDYADCKGLCGRKCNCWEWVCDDCCYHQGCYDHDVCCEIHGYFSSACFAVPECDKPYNCTTS